MYCTSIFVVASLTLTWIWKDAGGFTLRCTFSFKLTLRVLLKYSISYFPQAALAGNESRHWPACPHPNLLLRLNRSRCTPLTPPHPPSPSRVWIIHGAPATCFCVYMWGCEGRAYTHIQTQTQSTQESSQRARPLGPDPAHVWHTHKHTYIHEHTHEHWHRLYTHRRTRKGIEIHIPTLTHT